MKAIEISGVHLGSTLRSVTYPNKNKTARPSTYVANGPDGKAVYARQRTYDVQSIYMHENGNILINSSIYLRPDTEVEIVVDRTMLMR